MLDSLKDLYISHPFLPVADAPEWFSHIKDIRCVITFDAANNILQYKKNGNYVRAWLVGLTNISATIKILCKQLQDTPKYIEVLKAVWTDGVPSTENYMLTDSDYTAPVSFSGEYELNPDVLVIMQKAPAVYKDGTKLPVGLEFVDGHNVAVSKMDNGILLYGAAGAGREGVYETDPLGVLGEHQHGLSAKNINGMSGSVWLKGTFPVVVPNPTFIDASPTISIRVEDAE